MNQPARQRLTVTDDDVSYSAPRSITSDGSAEDQLVEGQMLSESSRILPGAGMGEGDHERDGAWFSGALREVHVIDIDPYDRNPRKAAHERYHELKQAIFAQNLLEVPTLTRRPGSARWMLASGGNTRIRIVRELWEETGDPRFEKYVFPIKPWRGDTNALLTHLSENEARAELCFWDRAFAFADLQQQIALEQGRAALSLREFEAALAAMGLRIGKTMLNNYRFLIQRLGPLENCAAQLSGTAVQSLLQPQLNKLSRLLAKMDGLDVDTAYKEVLSPAMRGYVDLLPDPTAFDAATLCQQLLAATADFLGHTSVAAERMLGLLDSAPDLDMTQLVESIAPRHVLPAAPHDGEAAAAPMHPDSQGVGEFVDAHAARQNEPTDEGLAGLSQPESPSWRHGAERATAQSFSRHPSQTEPRQAASGGSASLDDARRAVAEGALRFAEVFRIDHLYRPNAAMPSGFYMEWPGAETPISGDDQAKAFWWLVHFSQQMTADVCGAIPEPSEWVRTLGRNHPNNESGLVRWMISPSNHLDSFENLFRAVHALYSLDPTQLLPSNKRDDLDG